MIITHKMLIAKGACKSQCDLFKTLFGASVEVTEALCVKHASDFDWDWAAENLFPAPLWKQYEDAVAALWKQYEDAVAALWKQYEDAVAPLWKQYEDARAPLWKQYEDAVAPLFGRLAEGLVK